MLTYYVPVDGRLGNVCQHCGSPWTAHGLLDSVCPGQGRTVMLDRTTLRERLAALEHEQWSGWMMWLFKRSALNADGSVTIPPDLVARWKRQMLTDYAALSEDEQRSDLVEADKVLAVLGEMSR